MQTGTEIITRPSKKPPPVKERKRKINGKNVIALKRQGLTCTDIAKIEGTAISTITRYLKSIDPQLLDIKRYNDTKADALSLSQLKLQTVSDLIINNWLENPENIKSQDLRLQKEMLVAVQGAKTYEFQAERLERGKSTSNIAQLHADIAKIRELDDKIIDVESDE